MFKTGGSLFSIIALVSLAGCSVVMGPSKQVTASIQKLTEPAPLHLSVRFRVQLATHGLLTYRPQEFAQAAFDSNRLFIGSSAGKFYALSRQDGHILWEHQQKAAISSLPLYDAKRKIVYYGADDGSLNALDAETGQFHYSYVSTGPVTQPPVIAGALLFFTNNNDHLFALDVETGKWRWQYSREPPEGFTVFGYAGPTVIGNRVYTGFSDGYVVSLSTRSGDLLWAHTLARDPGEKYIDADGTPLPIGEDLLVTSRAEGLFRISQRGGAVIWHYDTNGAGIPALAGNRIYITTSDSLVCLDLSGHPLWSQIIPHAGMLSNPVIDGRYLYLTGAESGLYLINRDNGALLTYFNPGSGFAAGPSFIDNEVYVLSNDGYLYALHRDSL